MLLDTSGQSNLLANVAAGRAGQNQLGGIVLDSDNLGSSRGGTNVDHDHLVLGQLGNLGLLAIGGSHTEQAAEKVEVDLDLAVDIGKTALETQDETNETISTAKGRVDSGTDTDETTGNGVLEIVGLGVERNDSAEDGGTLEGTAVITGHDTRSDLNLVTQLDNTVKDRTTSNTTLEVIDLSTGLVDVEGSNDDHVRVHAEVTGRNGDSVDDGLVDGINVELELSRDGDDGRLSSNGASDELEDGLVVLLSSLFSHQVDLVLENDDLVELHDLNSSQMLRGLGLGAGFVASNKEQSSVHDGGT